MNALLEYLDLMMQGTSTKKWRDLVKASLALNLLCNILQLIDLLNSWVTNFLVKIIHASSQKIR